MRLRKLLILSSGFSFYCFFISFYLFGLYSKGDSARYTYFYNSLHDYSFIDGYSFYETSLGASEPIYYVMIFFFNEIVNKTIFFSFLNAFFGFILSKRLLKIGMHPILLILIAFNFYFLVLLIPAERLKVSIIFLLLSVSDLGLRYRITSLILSLLSHFQTFILIAARFKDTIKKLYLSLRFGNIKNIFKIVLLFLILLSVPYYFRDDIGEKLAAYNDEGGIKALVKPFFFLILNLFYVSRDKFEIWIIHLPIMIAAFFIGDSRLVIFSFGIFLYYALQYKRGINFGTLISLLYFAGKGIEFLINVKSNGHAF